MATLYDIYGSPVAGVWAIEADPKSGKPANMSQIRRHWDRSLSDVLGISVTQSINYPDSFSVELSNENLKYSDDTDYKERISQAGNTPNLTLGRIFELHGVLIVMGYQNFLRDIMHGWIKSINISGGDVETMRFSGDSVSIWFGKPNTLEEETVNSAKRYSEIASAIIKNQVESKSGEQTYGLATRYFIIRSDIIPQEEGEDKPIEVVDTTKDDLTILHELADKAGFVTFSRIWNKDDGNNELVIFFIPYCLLTPLFLLTYRTGTIYSDPRIVPITNYDLTAESSKYRNYIIEDIDEYGRTKYLSGTEMAKRLSAIVTSGARYKGTTTGAEFLVWSEQAEFEMTKYLFRAIEVSLEVEGNPALGPGITVWIEGLGDRFSGRYFIEEVTHDFSSSGYTCRLRCIHPIAGPVTMVDALRVISETFATDEMEAIHIKENEQSFKPDFLDEYVRLTIPTTWEIEDQNLASSDEEARRIAMSILSNITLSGDFYNQ